MNSQSERLGQSDKLQTDGAKAMVKAILDSAASTDVVFEDIANAGDEARANADGDVYVRVDNLTFLASAYQGPQQPELDRAGMSTTQMIEALKTSAEEWKVETAAQRNQDSAKLAAAIVQRILKSVVSSADTSTASTFRGTVSRTTR